MFVTDVDCILKLVVVEFLKNEWKKLKENFKRCIDKRARLTKSGAPAHALPKCKYFDQLMFVHDKVKNRETESNVVICDEDHEMQIPSTSGECVQDEVMEQPTTLLGTNTPSNHKRCAADNIVYYTPPSAKSKKRNELSMQVDSMLVKSLNDLKEPVSEPDDTDTYFCKAWLMF